MEKLLECVPNFSEGQNKETIEAIANAIRSVSGVKLLDIDPGFHAHRTVYTFVGSPQNVANAAFEAIKTASKLIDMPVHKGAHPRIGACDVCPFIPLGQTTMNEAIEISKNVAKRVADELNIPTYLYENSAASPERKNLAWLRKGEYENLSSKLLLPDFYPDFGKNTFNPKSGILITGARPFLIAYNVNLKSKDVEIAKKIASQIREKSPAGLPNVKAIGWYIDEFDKVQVSTNITDYTITPVYKVFNTISSLAQSFNTEVTGSELVGMIPLHALSECGVHFLKSNHQPHHLPQTELADYAEKYLGLSDVKAFDKHKKVIELAMNAD